MTLPVRIENISVCGATVAIALPAMLVSTLDHVVVPFEPKNKSGGIMLKTVTSLTCGAVLVLGLMAFGDTLAYYTAEAATPIQVYGVWHAGNDYCVWGSVRSLAEFDSKNHWLIA